MDTYFGELADLKSEPSPSLHETWVFVLRGMTFSTCALIDKMSFFTMESLATPSIIIPIIVGISLVGYFATLVIYRLFLSPVSKFPGPLLPAITRYYELYYDVILQGQYMYRIEEMHKQYGMSDESSKNLVLQEIDMVE